MRKLKFPLLFLLVLPFSKGGRYRRFIEWGADLAPGSFCSSRQSSPCCSGRDDNCTVEILGSLCYCDVFCNRASNDCCPDYASTSQGIAPPVTKAGCVFNGKEYKPSEVIRDNCNVCTCSRVQLFRYDWVCSNNSCLIDLERFNKTAQNLGWKTANYTRFWNKTFIDGIKENVGIATESKAQNMSSLQNKVQNDLPAFFDSRKKWKSWIHPVRDQRNCASSWAFSTVDVAADRLAIESKGLLTNQLSPQHLLSCDTRRKQRGCEGGSAEKAWWFIKRKGIMTEECYPYNVTQSNTSANKCLDNLDTCPNSNSSTSKIVLYVTPPYRVGKSEEEIKTEIYKKGPVQAHTCGVMGVAVDGMNQILVTAGLDGEIRFWGFKKHQKIDTLQTENYISGIVLHRESSMLAVALDNFQIFVVDLDTRRMVRKFQSHSNKVTGMSFSPDARWLISSAMDCTVRSWDLPSGRLVDCFSVEMAVTSLSMSPTADFLVTSHVDSVGVYTWYNKTLLSHVSLAPLPDDYQPQEVEMPDTRFTGGDDNQNAEDDTVLDDVDDYASPEQLSSELVTLSLLPNSRWHNLLNLDVIKMRNKPKEPPKVPKAAPFFLPTIPGLQPKFAVPENTEETDKKKSGPDLSRFISLGELGRRLDEGKENQSALGYLKELGPSAVDNEIRCLGPDAGGSVTTMCQFLHLISHVLDTKKDFEVANAYLGLFLKIHGDTISSHPELVEVLREVKGKLNQTWTSIQDLFTLNLTLLTHLRTAKI